MTGDIWYSGRTSGSRGGVQDFRQLDDLRPDRRHRRRVRDGANLGVPLRRPSDSSGSFRSAVSSGPRGEDGVGRSHGDVRVDDGAQGHAADARGRRATAARRCCRRSRSEWTRRSLPVTARRLWGRHRVIRPGRAGRAGGAGGAGQDGRNSPTCPTCPTRPTCPVSVRHRVQHDVDADRVAAR